MDSSQVDFQLDSVSQEDLICFFRHKKTEITSNIEDPLLFLTQLKNYNLVQEEDYKKAIKKKSKEAKQKYMYEILDWLEKERGQFIKVFWSCVFQDHILLKYPFLRLLKNNLLEKSSRSDAKLPRAGKQRGNEEKVVEQEQVGRKRKRGNDEANKEDAGPSVTSSSQKKPTVYSVKESSEELKDFIKNEDRGQEDEEEDEDDDDDDEVEEVVELVEWGDV